MGWGWRWRGDALSMKASARVGAVECDVLPCYQRVRVPTVPKSKSQQKDAANNVMSLVRGLKTKLVALKIKHKAKAALTRRREQKGILWDGVGEGMGWGWGRGWGWGWGWEWGRWEW